MLMKIVFLVIVTVCLCLIPSGAFACVCGSSDPPVEFSRAKAVFIGEMLGGTEKFSLKDDGDMPRSIEAGSVRFTVEEVFKGNVINETTIEIASMDGTSCGPYGLTRGERYLVYAYGDEKNDAILYTGVCTRTKRTSSPFANQDLDFLRNLPPAGTGGNLRGRISADLKVGGVTWLADVKVDIKNADNEVVTVRTDKEGKFEVRKLKPGKYTVEPEFPANYLPSYKSAEVTIEDRGTADVGFGAVLDTRVAGRVVDRDGQGFNSAFLQFEGGGKKSIYGHSLGGDGAFEVVGAPPGEYLLYIEMQSEDDKRNRKYYYPGTFKLDEATTIKVGLDARIEELEFVLPGEFKVRTVEGQVTWPDGKPAVDAEVMLGCRRSSRKNGLAVEYMPTRTRTDEQGRFRLEGFSSELYWLQAWGSKDHSGKSEVDFHPSRRKLLLNENLKNLKLILSEAGSWEGCDEN
jgi:hypothetical protein